MDRLRKHRRAPSDGKYILAPAIRPGARPKMAPQRLVRLLDGMRKLTALVLVLVALAGCSSATMHARTRNLLSFTETDGAGREVRQLSFVLTDEPAKTCIPGDWKKARVVNDEAGYTKAPAYTLESGKLEVLLVNQMCDAHDSYVGVLAGGRFQGEHVAYGLGFSKTLGKVSGTYATN